MKSGLPSIDEKCGENYTFRDLCDCGETKKNAQVLNVPKQLDSYRALTDLALNVIDPVIDMYGPIILTYGFSGHELSKKIMKGIAPNLDQHSAYETNSKGKQICSRGGAAIDFIVPDKDMHDVAVWLIQNCDFDRLYFYGKGRPIHVSYGPEHSKQIVQLKRLEESGKIVPYVLPVHKFLNLRKQD